MSFYTFKHWVEENSDYFLNHDKSVELTVQSLMIIYELKLDSKLKIISHIRKQQKLSK